MKQEKSFKLWNSGSWGLFLGFALILFLSAGVASSEERVIVSSIVGECSLAVESNETWHTLRLRAHHPKYRECHIDQNSVVAVLSTAFSKTESPMLEGIYSSLFIGRLIDYPWLCQYLATTAFSDRGWDSKKGKPTALGINKYVAQLLFRREVVTPIDTALGKGGYKVAGVTVEKVLVGGFHEVPFYQGTMHPGRVPYDAQVWFRLKKT
jgi:hypothetical protein